MSSQTRLSTEPIEYNNRYDIAVADSDWECPNCGDDGERMYRPGSKDTCARCFWVVNGRNNDYVLDYHGIGYREAQKRLAENGMKWHGSPGDVATRYRRLEQ